MSLADYGNAELLVYRLGVRKDTVKVPEEVLAACQYDMDDSVESTCDINGDYIKAGSRLYPHISQTLRPFLAKRDFGFSSLPTSAMQPSACFISPNILFHWTCGEKYFVPNSLLPYPYRLLKRIIRYLVLLRALISAALHGERVH